MKKKEKLTEEDIQLMYQIRDEILEKFFSLEYDEDATFELVDFIYEVAGLEKPIKIMMDSPLAIQLKANELMGNSKENLKYWMFGHSGDITNLGWVAYYRFFRKLGVVEHEVFEKFEKLILKAMPFLMLQFDTHCLISRPPKELYMDDQGRMHRHDGAAIIFRDGVKAHFVHGLFFKPEDFEKYFIDKIDFKTISQLSNAEERTVILMERLNDIIQDPNAKANLIDEYFETVPDKTKEPHYEPYKDNEQKEMFKILQEEGYTKARAYEIIEKGREVYPTRKCHDRLYTFKYMGENRHVVVLEDHTTPGKYSSHLVQPCKTVREAIKWMNHGIDPEEIQVSS